MDGSLEIDVGQSHRDHGDDLGRNSLLRPGKSGGGRCYGHAGPCCAGLLSGLAIGSVIGAYLPGMLFAVTGHDLLPTVIHKMALFIICWVFGPCLLGGGCACMASRRRRSRITPAGQRLGPFAMALATACALGISAVALAVPGAAQDSLKTTVTLLFLGEQWPAEGYCEAAADAQRERQAFTRRTGKPWWHMYGPDADSAAAALVGNMTRAERHGLLNGEGYGPFGQLTNAYVGGTKAIPRLLLPSTHLQDAAQGFRTSKNSIIGQVTSWPCLLGLAATWDATLTHRFAVALGHEFRGKGANVILGPSLNVHRVARNGRNAEYLSGEEAHLGAVLTTHYVEGVQSVGLAACAKHFALNHQETDRMTTSPFASDRTMFEVYYPPFEAAINAGVASFMCAYNKINGSQACGNPHVLNTHLRGALGFKGWVMSDWWALREPAAATHGVDQDMPGTDGYFDAPRLASLPDSDALEALMATRILRGMLISGALDEPICTAGCDCAQFLYGANVTSGANVALARQIGAESAVLLKNDGAVLPLNTTGATVALVGSACGAPHAIDAEAADWTVGDYYVVGGSGRTVSDRAVSIRAALEARGVALRVSASDGLGAALGAASGADVVLACGSGVTWESEDRRTLKLDQHDLLAGLAAARKAGTLAAPLVVAVMAPGQVAVSPWAEGADGVVAMFLAGQETGNAWADVLLGAVNPSGKLPVTFPLKDEDMAPPCTGAASDHCVYSEGLAPSWRGLIGRDVGFAFGSGLSYTTFSYSWVHFPEPERAGGATLSVAVTNVGMVPGAEVVQLYLTFPAGAGEPPLVLRGFEKTPVLPRGSSHTVRFKLTRRMLSTWMPVEPSAGEAGAAPTAAGGQWQPVSGSFEVRVASGSRDVRLHKPLVMP
jgi:beta-glucosidase